MGEESNTRIFCLNEKDSQLPGGLHLTNHKYRYLWYELQKQTSVWGDGRWYLFILTKLLVIKKTIQTNI